MKIKIPITITENRKRVSENEFGGTTTLNIPLRRVAEGNLYPEDNVQLNWIKEGYTQQQFSSLAQLVRMIPNVKGITIILETDDEP